MTAAGGLGAQTSKTRPVAKRRRPRLRWYLVACVVLLICAGGGYWLWARAHLRHPTAFSEFAIDAGAKVTVGTTVTFPLSPDPWRTEHGMLHVHSIALASVEHIPPGATLTVWRCTHSNVGAPDGPNLGESRSGRICAGAERVSGPFDIDASRGSREALLLAVQSPTRGVVRFRGVDIDYREGRRSGRQLIDVHGVVRFRNR